MNTPFLLSITVDMEHAQRQGSADQIDTMIYGRINGEVFGFPKIAELCAEYGYLATFFVSVFDWPKSGEDRLAEACRLIKQNGHDVQLHTHPQQAFDSRRFLMSQYSLEEQVRIIEAGAKRLRGVTGERPIAHRAGAYGLNADTITALKLNNINIDTRCSIVTPIAK